MNPGERVELELTYEDLDTLLTALDIASVWAGPCGRRPLVSAWRAMEQRFGEVLSTNLDDTGPAEPDTDEYRSGPEAGGEQDA